MTSRRVFIALLAGLNATSAIAEGDIGSPLETCEQGVIVKDWLGATGRIISEVAGMCLVTFPSGTENVAPGGANMHPPASLTRAEAFNVISETGVIVGEYRCSRASDQFEFYFELAGDGTYTLQEDSGTYETPDKNSIAFIGGEFDGVSGWMHQGSMGLTQGGGDDEMRCVVQ